MGKAAWLHPNIVGTGQVELLKSSSYRGAAVSWAAGSQGQLQGEACAARDCG